MLAFVGDPADMYFSLDVEADGPIPGEYSMLSFGIALAGRFDGKRFQALDPTAETFYVELRPISDRYDDQALAVSSLDRDALLRDGRDPATAMDDAAGWVRALAGPGRPVMVGFPLVFDWMFAYWYFERFGREGSPFDFSSGLDMKSMYAAKAGVTLSQAGKDDVPGFLRGPAPHTHQALGDAIEQAQIFSGCSSGAGPLAGSWVLGRWRLVGLLSLALAGGCKAGA